MEIKEKEFPHSLTKTRVQMTVVPEARHEIDAVRRRWQGLVDQVAIKGALVRQHQTSDVKEGSPRPCRVLWQRLDIHYDGSVWLCDNDYYGKYCVGHFPEESIYDIWHGEKMTRMRQIHAAGRRHEIEPCQYCDGL